MMHDVLIIGGGPGGLAAAIYSTRAGAKTLLIDRVGPGGQAAMTEKIENYPGFPQGIGGLELTDAMAEQAKKFGLKIESGDVASIARGPERGFTITTRGESFQGLAVVLACGSVHKHLGVPGEDKFFGRGVHYCATCDGPFYKNKHVAVVGGGDSAIEEALFLSKFASKITLVHRRDSLRATRILQDRIQSNPKAGFLWNSEVAEILGENSVNAVKIKNRASGETSVHAVDGVFVFAGLLPDTGFLRGFIELDKDGYIVTDDEMRASVPGIFACGDARKKPLRQVITACGDGAVAGVFAARFAEEAGRST
ncbi:MAG: thioredoxin-disulfide reductase [Planctomycetota bacterium]|nr:thioredoxin-disulfide reductase [Planctomycetota bacterium]